MTRFTVESRPTFRDLGGRFARANDDLLDIRREELRTEGRFLVNLTKKKLKDKTAPYSSSKLENAIRFNTRSDGQTVRLSVTTPSQAGPHKIAPLNAQALAFNWPRVGMMTFVPRGGGFKTHVRAGQLWVGKGYVDHPGGSLVPLFTPLLEDANSEWSNTRGRAVLNRISLRYVKSIT